MISSSSVHFYVYFTNIEHFKIPENGFIKIQVQQHAEGVEREPGEDEDDHDPDQEHHRLFLLPPSLLLNQTRLSPEK